MAKLKIDLQPQVLNLVLYAGDGTKFRVIVTDPAGVAVPLTGTMKAQIRGRRDDPDPPAAVFEVDLADAAQGLVGLLLPGDQTQPLAASEKFEGVWDLEWTATGAEPLTLCQGSVECWPDVSR